MGKPFDVELEALPASYTWAMSQPIQVLARAVERLQPYPLLAVGSGGSFSVCHFVCHLHGVFAKQPALPTSPLQAVASRTPVAEMGVIIPTAGGNNPDVVAAVRLLTEQEPPSLLVLCGNSNSRVAAQAARHRMIDFVAYDLPFGKDGFLATNSLLTFCVLVSRAYAEVAGQSSGLPKDFRALLNERKLVAQPTALDRRLQDLLARPTLVVLHGPATVSAAVDIESKFTEAALGQVQICDYRQFAHGRHHWLAKRPAETAVLSLESLDDELVASQTLALLPETVPSRRLIVSRRSWLADLGAICEGFYLAGTAGRLRGIDPGRPGVPSFGRKLYHANAFPSRSSSGTLPAWKVRAIERKAAENVEQLLAESRLSFWLSSLEAVLDELAAARFQGLVVDYDGTLCDEDERFDPLPTDSVEAVSAILASGALLGVATGRGKSVRERLQEAIPKKHWPRIIVGYYNGGQILSLDDAQVPDGRDQIGPELATIAEAVGNDGLLTQGTITLRQTQITLSGMRGLSLQGLCEHAEAIANRVAPDRVRVMRSGHSVDIVPQAVSKLSVVKRIRELAGQGDDAPILRIGDRGRWPGNDAQLLASVHGLSVHEVSSDAGTCWNLAQPGQRGRQATTRYLSQLKVSKRGLRLQPPAKAGATP